MPHPSQTTNEQQQYRPPDAPPPKATYGMCAPLARVVQLGVGARLFFAQLSVVLVAFLVLLPVAIMMIVMNGAGKGNCFFDPRFNETRMSLSDGIFFKASYVSVTTA